jgi:hypothetical protein
LLPTTSQIDHRLSPKKEKGGRNRKEEKVPAAEARGARAGRRLRRRKERGGGGSPVVQAQRQRPEHIGRSSAGPPSPPCRPSSARPRPAPPCVSLFHHLQELRAVGGGETSATTVRVMLASVIFSVASLLRSSLSSSPMRSAPLLLNPLTLSTHALPSPLPLRAPISPPVATLSLQLLNPRTPRSCQTLILCFLYRLIQIRDE